ncbi:hypothetical protein RIR_jg14157.t1 [Rhizophagus irregularis DAOM 181602=DAOM 197198]|nr:hypothetical protein RIR_jg14157.t1 [Rhizophagus irregularis DAOM 181602=DAOM 197198]
MNWTLGLRMPDELAILIGNKHEELFEVLLSFNDPLLLAIGNKDESISMDFEAIYDQKQECTYFDELLRRYLVLMIDQNKNVYKFLRNISLNGSLLSAIGNKNILIFHL